MSAFIYSKAANRTILIYSATKRLWVALLAYENPQRVTEVGDTLRACLSETHPSFYFISAPLKISVRCWEAESVLSHASHWQNEKSLWFLRRPNCSGNLNVGVVAFAELQIAYFTCRPTCLFFFFLHFRIIIKQKHTIKLARYILLK